MTKKINVKQKILSANDHLAQDIHQKLVDSNTFSLNIMASPGAGKTSLILNTIKALKEELTIAVIDGDVVEIDTNMLKSLNIQVELANTGGACHLDATMVQKAMEKIYIEDADLLIIENVGNLVCPANFKIGTHQNIVIASVPEGDDKPYKYPGMFKGADVLILNKADYLEHEDFDLEYFQAGVQRVNPDVIFFTVSCKTGEGLDDWLDWVVQETQKITQEEPEET